MSKFTKGQGYYEEYIPEGVTLNGKEYLIQSENKEDVALVRTEADARLIAHVPEMYAMLHMLAKIAENYLLKKMKCIFLYQKAHLDCYLLSIMGRWRV